MFAAFSSPPHLSLVGKEGVCFTANSLLATIDAESGWSQMGEAETLVPHQVRSLLEIDSRQWARFLANSRLSIGYGSSHCLLSITKGVNLMGN